MKRYTTISDLDMLLLWTCLGILTSLRLHRVSHDQHASLQSKHRASLRPSGTAASTSSHTVQHILTYLVRSSGQPAHRPSHIPIRLEVPSTTPLDLHSEAPFSLTESTRSPPTFPKSTFIASPRREPQRQHGTSATRQQGPTQPHSSRPLTRTPARGPRPPLIRLRGKT